MWKEEIEEIIHNGGLHDIDYLLKNGKVCTYYVRGIRYSTRYGKDFIEVYCSCADARISYWDWRTFKISSIKAIDGKTYEESIGYKEFQTKIAAERRKEEHNKQQSVQSKENPHEAGYAIAGVLGMACMIIGGALLGTLGGVIGFIAGNLVGFIIGDNIDRQ